VLNGRWLYGKPLCIPEITIDIVRCHPNNVSQKPSIAKNVPPEQVTLKVPHEFRSSIDARLLAKGPYTVVAFPGMRSSSSSIVNSSTIARALEKVESEPGTVVAVAHDFTTEARDLLTKHGAILFSRGDWSWTDASLAKVRSNERG
jgi:hypothetical protein